MSSPGATCERLSALSAAWLSANRSETKILAEKWDNVVLEPIGHPTRVSARIYFEDVGDSVVVERIMQLAGVRSQTVLISNIDRDRTILPNISDVLINKS